jgi:hypothetical protein
MTSPKTNTWSPMSTSAFQAASDSGPTLSSEIIACSSVPDAPPSRNVAKHSLPVLRMKMIRPVTPTRSPVATSGGRSGWRATTSASVAVRGTDTG